MHNDLDSTEITNRQTFLRLLGDAGEVFLDPAEFQLTPRQVKRAGEGQFPPCLTEVYPGLELEKVQVVVGVGVRLLDARVEEGWHVFKTTERARQAARMLMAREN